MKLHLFTALAAASFAYAQNHTIVTWLSTSHIREVSFSTSTIQYGNTPITPVPSKTEPIVLVTSIVTEPTASRNFNFTSFYTAQVTLPVTTQLVTVRSHRPSPPTITLSGTATTTVWATPTIATVTFASTICANGNDTLPSTTITTSTGTYSPFPGQPSTLPTIFPTAVTTWFHVTAFYKVYPYSGTTVTYYSTVTGTNYLSTVTAGTTTVDPMDGARGYTQTSYVTTVTTTIDVPHIAFSTSTATTACAADGTATVTFNARCAPTNLIAEREGRGIGIKPVAWMEWTPTFPMITNVDASGCCQLCMDSEGCVLSEWVTSKWLTGGCQLYYWNHRTQNGAESCGPAESGKGLEYFADVHALPRLGSFVQGGCGEARYVGAYDAMCPACKVE
ncbi:hypothetical protein GE09DRAFT_1067885 [Coniochaeta sp. 2T2.1]|nr:hypothetical protein GE09DRAFT_1067885 [Coniochaeta sp. 2T2.1]